MNAQKHRERVAKLRALDSCSVSDALDSLGLPPAVTGLAPLSVSKPIAGPVLTVKLCPGKPVHGSMRHLGTAAIEAADSGDIIVIEHSAGIDCAGWGGVLSVGARIRGIEGVIIDGPARDIDQARELEFPVYGRSATARTARGRAFEQDFGCRITISDAVVEPGDIALADASGVVFIPRAHFASVLDRAERIAERERLMTAALQRGDPITEVVGRDYEEMLDALD